MLIQSTFEASLDRIGEHTVLVQETIFPAEVETLSHSPYRPEYAWLFTVERRLGRILDPWLRQYRDRIIGPDGLLSEALSNAYCHGHRRNPTLGIDLRVVVGKFGILVSIVDSGDGFDHREIARNVTRKKNYYHNSGRGLYRMLTEECFQVFYTQQGRAFNLLHITDAHGRE